MSVVDKPIGLVFLGGTYDVSAEFVDALGGESQMSHDRDARCEYAAYRLENFFTAFELDGIGAGFFHYPYRRGESLLGVALICAERHVNYD